ncbi:MAG: alanine dehydrogenase [Planctomycetes bacterium]|nr:alanine dehydrogenase [Planctomycetota bacterium]
MKIGVPKEIKNNENRVALTPAGVDRLRGQGHEVMVETRAGLGSGLSDEAYQKAGAAIAPDAATVWAKNDLVLKVKEPLESEWPHMRKGQTLFTYLHLAADRKLTDGVVGTGSYGFAYETLEVNHGLPLLTPMSEVAGRMAIQEGAKYLEAPLGGSGILLGGVPGVRPAKVMILGGGVVGTQAARMAAGLGADVTILDVNLDRMRYLDEVLPQNCATLYSTPYALRELLPETDLLVGAVLIAGAAAPKLVKRADLKLMRKGSVIVDVAVDQGGCIETVRPTTHAEPTYVVDGVVHYCVANMPGAVPRTSTWALTNATLPWVELLAKLGPVGAIESSPELRGAANCVGGHITCKPVADAFGLPFVPPLEAVRASR